MTTCSLIACSCRPQSGQVYVAGFWLCARLTAHHSAMPVSVTLSIRLMEFDQFTVVVLLTPADPPELDDAEAEKLQDAHLNHLATLHESGRLLAAGPLPGEPGRRFRGAEHLRHGPDEARALAEEDPAVQAGWFELVVLPWMVPAGAVRFDRDARFPHSASEARS
jgi:uncharacterized protein YciI